MGIIDRYGYSKENPPESCIKCLWHRRTLEPKWLYRTLGYDYCGNTQYYFAKMHIILRGEFRKLSKHDEEDLDKHLPYECPFFNMSRVFWEFPEVIKMDWEMFIYECAMHPEVYTGMWIYSLPDIIEILKSEIPPKLGLNYISVEPNDRQWFIETFGDRTVLISPEDPYNVVIPLNRLDE